LVISSLATTVLLSGEELGCDTLYEFLKANDRFTTLSLRGNNISQGFVILANYIAHSQSLRQYLYV